VAFSPDGQWVVSAGCDERTEQRCIRGSTRVWEAATGREVARVTHESGARVVTFSPDGRWIASGWDEDTVLVWEAATGREIARITRWDLALAIAFSPDGRWIAIGSSGGSVEVWDISLKPDRSVASGREVARIPSGQVVAFSPDEQWVLTNSYSEACVWEAATGRKVAHVTQNSEVKAVGFSPDGQWVLSAGCDENDNSNSRCLHGSVLVWEAATGREVVRVTHESLVYAVALSLDGQQVVSVGCDEYDSSGTCLRSTALVWETATGHEVARVAHENKVNAVAFSPNGQWVVSGGGVTARVWEAATGREVTHVIHRNQGIVTVAFSPDGQWVVSSNADGMVRVWEAATGNEVTHIETGIVGQTVGFSPNGQWVLSRSNNQAWVWEAATGREVTCITHEDEVTVVAFSPDGQWLVSGSADGTARVWEVATGHEVVRMTHGRYVDAVAFSPDGRWVASSGWDGTTRVWWWQPEDMIRLACERLTRGLTYAEQQQYLGDEPYRAICPNLPIPEE